MTAIDARTGEVTLGDHDNLVKDRFTISSVRWLHEPLPEELEVMSRYRAPRLRCRVEVSSDNRWQVVTNGRVLASPGQAAVFYCGKQVIGGGMIVAS